MTMFSPKGEKSRRVMILDLAADRDYGDLIEYTELETLLDLDRREAQTAMNQAIRSLEKQQSKTVVAVRNKGYRIVNPNEHIKVATAHQRKSRRSLVRAKSKVDHIDLTKLSEGERAAITIAGAALAAQQDFARRADLRYAKRAEMEKFIHKQEHKNVHTDEEMNTIKARMARLEALIEQRDAA